MKKFSQVLKESKVEEIKFNPYKEYGWNCRCPAIIAQQCNRPECPRKPNNPKAQRLIR